ncbi:MAG TPA: AIM24 family protein [Verrucomicrobiaceae bacterium]
MSRLQVGNSRCQIEGMYVPVADFNLAAGDRIYFAHHVLLWKDPGVEIQRMSLKGAFSRLMAGLPIIMTEAHGPGHIAFSRDEPGEMIALPLQPGQSIDVREHMFLAATHQVAYDWFNTGVWFITGSGKEAEYHYPIGKFMDRFTAGDAPGLLLLHAGGNVFVRELLEHQTLLIKPTTLVYADPTVRMAMHIDYVGSPIGTPWSYSSILWLHLSGPGRVAVQSAYEPMEANGRTITGHTSRSWSRAQLAVAQGRQYVPGANAPPSGAGAHVDQRHDQIEKMVIAETVNGEVPPAAVARIVEAAGKTGLTGYDVRLIINQVKTRNS